MKGYFTRIAKQSGLRYIGQSARTPDVYGSDRRDAIAPIGQEETVLSQSPISEARALFSKDAVRAPEIEAHRIQEREHHTERGQVPAVRSQTTGQFASTVPARTVERDGDADFVAPLASGTRPRALAEEIAAQGLAHGDFVPVEKAVISVPAQANAAAGDVAGRGLIEPASRPEIEPTQFIASERGPENSEFFSKTTAMIERGEVGSVDIQTVFFQEVQDWVASSPLDATKEQGDLERVAADEITEVARPHVKNFVNSVRSSSPPFREQQARPVEQNFELSIGSISVVIEEPEKPRPVEPPAQQNNRVAVQEDGARFSRLNRSYL